MYSDKIYEMTEIIDKIPADKNEAHVIGRCYYIAIMHVGHSALLPHYVDSEKAMKTTPIESFRHEGVEFYFETKNTVFKMKEVI